jgi:hypothetical protein
MRKNTAEVLRAWKNNKPSRKSESIWTDGENIWSYGTCILTARKMESDPLHSWIFNNTKYSVTTSQQQSALRAELGTNRLLMVDDLRRGARPEDLVRAAEAI